MASPVKQGAPNATFDFTANLKNDSGEDLVVDLSSTQPQNIQVTILSAGQDANELDLPANSSKILTIKAEPLITLENNGTAPLGGIDLSSREPSGWSVSFDQTQAVGYSDVVGKLTNERLFLVQADHVRNDVGDLLGS